jgi:hypothetical protein
MLGKTGCETQPYSLQVNPSLNFHLDGNGSSSSAQYLLDFFFSLTFKKNIGEFLKCSPSSRPKIVKIKLISGDDLSHTGC